MLIGNWQAVKLENPSMDSFFSKSQLYIDTVGKGNDAATNFAIYGVTNMDSMRKVLQEQYDSAKMMQAYAVSNTFFNFRKDSIVVLSFNGNVDSSKWYLDESGGLVLDELNNTAAAEKIKMVIVALGDTVLKLRFEENGAKSTVTFHPTGK